MKPKFASLSPVIFLAAVTSAAAADLTWNTGNPASTVWTAAGVWSGSTWAANDSANFTASATVNLGSAISQTGITIASGQTLTLNNTGDIKITGTGGITGNLSKTGGNNLRLSHSGGFNGTLTIGGNHVIIGSAASDPVGQTSNLTKVNITSGGFILGSAYNGGFATIGELSGGSSGSVRADWADGGTNNHRGLIVDQNTDTTFSGTFNAGSSGRGIHLTKSGTGILTISNNAALVSTNDGVRNIAVTGGTLRISGSTGTASPVNNIAGTSLAISSGATFDAANTTSGIPTGITKTISGAGTFLRSGTGNLLISGTDNAGFTGVWKATSGTFGFLSETSMGGSSGVTLDGGGLFINANGAGISSAKTITLGSGGGYFDGATGWTQTWSARITGSGGITKRSGMTLVLDGASNDYTGPTNIQTGTLKLGSANAISSSSQIIVGASTTLDVSAVSWTLGSAQTLSGVGTVAGNATIAGDLAPGSSPGTLTFGNDLSLTSASDWLVELGGTGAGTFDRIVVGGALTAGGLIKVSLINGFNPANSSSFDIADFGSFVGAGYGFDFSAAPLDPGLTWDTGAFSTTGTIAVIPEQSVALLGGIGALVLLRRRRGR